MEIICFHNPDEENGYLSNWYESKFIVDHVKFSSMEQFMVYTRRLSDTELSEFKYNVNDDEYIQKIVEVTNLSSLLQSLGNKEKLFISGCWIW